MHTEVLICGCHMVLHPSRWCICMHICVCLCMAGWDLEWIWIALPVDSAFLRSFFSQWVTPGWLTSYFSASLCFFSPHLPPSDHRPLLFNISHPHSIHHRKICLKSPTLVHNSAMTGLTPVRASAYCVHKLWKYINCYGWYFRRRKPWKIWG